MLAIDVRVGVKSGPERPQSDFRSSPNKGHHASERPLPKSATTGLMRQSKVSYHLVGAGDQGDQVEPIRGPMAAWVEVPRSDAGGQTDLAHPNVQPACR